MCNRVVRFLHTCVFQLGPPYNLCKIVREKRIWTYFCDISTGKFAELSLNVVVDFGKISITIFDIAQKLELASSWLVARWKAELKTYHFGCLIIEIDRLIAELRRNLLGDIAKIGIISRKNLYKIIISS